MSELDETMKPSLGNCQDYSSHRFFKESISIEASLADMVFTDFKSHGQTMRS